MFDETEDQDYLSHVVDIENMVSEGKISDEGAMVGLAFWGVPEATARSMIEMAKAA